MGLKKDVARYIMSQLISRRRFPAPHGSVYWRTLPIRCKNPASGKSERWQAYFLSEDTPIVEYLVDSNGFWWFPTNLLHPYDQDWSLCVLS